MHITTTAVSKYDDSEISQCALSFLLNLHPGGVKMIGTSKSITQMICLPFAVLSILSACSSDNHPQRNKNTLATPVLNYVVNKSYPHDTGSFTEGLVFYNGKLYESTGAPEDIPMTKSLFGMVDMTTGKIQVKAQLDKKKYFGEGIAFLKDKVYQLTYTTKVGFVYSASTFKQSGIFTLPSLEGWGLTTDGKSLIMSDGTSRLTYINPFNLQIFKTIDVSENGYQIDHLNELEYINKFIYANIWMTNTIVKINPQNGHVVAKMDLSSLAAEVAILHPGALEMNGIAFDSTTDAVLVTGKLWPRIYEIKFSR